ncbi:MAG: nucleotide sugar dehydrogenase, partial [Pseudomonadota bacterium]
YAANAFLATKITFVNEIATLCESVGADVRAVARGMGLDARIGQRFLQAGPGYGGSCFPKDTRALARTAEQNGVALSVLGATIRANDEIKRRMIDKIEDLCPGGFAGARVAVLGVTFKAETDDMREAPALTIVPAMVGRGASVRVHDPQGRREGEALLPGVQWFDDAESAVAGADVLVVLTEWGAFRTLDLAALAASMRSPHLVDLRNLYAPEDVAAAGFTAHAGIGIAPRLPAEPVGHADAAPALRQAS